MNKQNTTNTIVKIENKKSAATLIDEHNKTLKTLTNAKIIENKKNIENALAIENENRKNVVIANIIRTANDVNKYAALLDAINSPAYKKHFLTENDDGTITAQESTTKITFNNIESEYHKNAKKANAFTNDYLVSNKKYLAEVKAFATNLLRFMAIDANDEKTAEALGVTVPTLENFEGAATMNALEKQLNIISVSIFGTENAPKMLKKDVKNILANAFKPRLTDVKIDGKTKKVYKFVEKTNGAIIEYICSAFNHRIFNIDYVVTRGGKITDTTADKKTADKKTADKKTSA